MKITDGKQRTVKAAGGVAPLKETLGPVLASDSAVETRGIAADEPGST